jgi:hypothetical protein
MYLAAGAKHVGRIAGTVPSRQADPGTPANYSWES